MSGECDKCGEHCLDCICDAKVFQTLLGQIPQEYLDDIFYKNLKNIKPDWEKMKIDKNLGN